MKVIFENLNMQSQLSGLTGFDHLQLLIEKQDRQRVALRDVIVFPGLVNAHDHLEFNLFPFLANRRYTNYKEWSSDIHINNKNEIAAVLQIPIELRIKWGILKNLISGVTCIVHHGKHHELIRSLGYPVHLTYQYIHAIDTEPYWRLKLLLPLKEDIMIHVGEGVSAESEQEIDKILKWNLVHRKLLGIHAICMNEQQSKKFKSVVWCPDSNLRLYGKTARVDLLKKHTKILFGTDSALSASSNIWEHLRSAKSLNLLSPEEILDCLIKQPGNVLHEISDQGIVVAKKKNEKLLDSFFDLNPEDLLLVVVNNKVTLIDQSILDGLTEGYTLVKVGNSKKWIESSLASVIHELEARGVNLPLQVSTP
ncbi:MAG TPA: hypothetical protein VFG46_08115 [Chryseolinea sp.]|nr:hypothetical protein [Chryseolinea sp.]